MNKQYYKEKFKQIMTSKEIKQYQLADEIGVSVATIKRFQGTLGDDKWIPSKEMLEIVNEYISSFVFEDKKEDSKIDVVQDTSELYCENRELKEEVLRLGKSLQKQLDNNRILRKTNRISNRESIINDGLLEELLKNIPNCNLPTKQTKDKDRTYENELLVQISDWHIGQKVSIRNNEFNFQVALQRARIYFNEVIRIAELTKSNCITIAFTGDLLNLDSRLDQLLTSEKTRAEALMVAFDIIRQHIADLVFLDYNVKIVGVVGNESRLKGDEFFSSSDNLAIDSFDYILYQMLKRSFEGSVEFLNDCEYINDIITIKGKHIGITHGNYFKNLKTDEMQSFKSNLYEQTGKMADYIIFGHIHDTLISNTFARSGSLVGANGYSNNALNIANSMASQNIHVINEKQIYTLRVKLD